MASTAFPIEPWATSANLPASLTLEQIAEVNPATLAAALRVAGTILFNLTGQRWLGQQPLRRWPTQAFTQCGGCRHLVGRGIAPIEGCGGCGIELDLGYYPVMSVAEVRIGVSDDPLEAEIVAADRYQIQDGGRCVVWQPALDGSGRRSWPTEQRVGAPENTEGTWSISFLWGRPIPEDCSTMAGLLGWELALAMTPGSGDACRLPRKTRSAVRRGRSQVQDDPMQLVTGGLVGLPEVDLWVASIAAGSRRRRATVRKPGHSRVVRTRS